MGGRGPPMGWRPMGGPGMGPQPQLGPGYGGGMGPRGGPGSGPSPMVSVRIRRYFPCLPKDVVKFAFFHSFDLLTVPRTYLCRFQAFMYNSLTSLFSPGWSSTRTKWPHERPPSRSYGSTRSNGRSRNAATYTATGEQELMISAEVPLSFTRLRILFVTGAQQTFIYTKSRLQSRRVSLEVFDKS